MLEINTTYVAASRVGAAFPGARGAALWQASAQPMTMPFAPAASALPAVNRTRKHNNVHKTRISAGGYGAMGSHPEREPA